MHARRRRAARNTCPAGRDGSRGRRAAAAVGGANSKWISGDLLQQTGLNCSTAILGSSYTEVMVSGIASYGGLDSVPKVGDPYWTAFLVSIPGNPCGSGSSSVVTTLVMPPNTQVDTSRQVKCYGLPRNTTTPHPGSI